MEHVTVVSHPLIQHSLTILRNKETSTADFRFHANIVSRLLFIEATRRLRVHTQEIETPLAVMQGKKLEDEVVLVPVLRAGLAMLFAAQDFLPSSLVGFIGLARDEQTAQAHEYYKKLPRILAESKVIVLDPMLATGGSLDDTVQSVRKKGGHDVTIACIVAAPEGLERMKSKHPDVRIFTAAIDERLDDKKFIVPGLGDFGDRYFGTV